MSQNYFYCFSGVTVQECFYKTFPNVSRKFIKEFCLEFSTKIVWQLNDLIIQTLSLKISTTKARFYLAIELDIFPYIYVLNIKFMKTCNLRYDREPVYSVYAYSPWLSFSFLWALNKHCHGEPVMVPVWSQQTLPRQEPGTLLGISVKLES